MKMRGFTLIEVLLVMMIIFILLLGSITLTVKYSADLQWNRLFNRLEQLVLDVNTYALAGISFGFEGEVERLPDMHHLFITKGDPVVWYLESRADDGDERKIVFQKKHDLEVSVMDLENIFLESDGEKRSAEQILLSWENPNAQLRFYPEADIEFSGDGLEESFELGETSEVCEENCSVTLEYVRAGAERHRISVDSQKGIYRDFY